MMFGQALVQTEFYGYRKLSKRSGRIMSLHTLSNLPSVKYSTNATWIELPRPVVAEVEQAGFDVEHAKHGAQHLLLVAAGLTVQHDPGDAATEHAYPFQKRSRPSRLIVFDAAPSGTGVAVALIERGGWVWVRKALEIATTCPCGADGTGCPACILGSSCPENHQAMSRPGAVALLRALIALIDAAAGGGDDEAETLDLPGGAGAGFHRRGWVELVDSAKRAAVKDVEEPGREWGPQAAAEPTTFL